MGFKALYLVAAWTLLSSCLFVSVSCACYNSSVKTEEAQNCTTFFDNATTPHTAANETTKAPATVNATTPSAAITTAVSNVTNTTETVPTTTKSALKPTTAKPPAPTATGSSNSTAVPFHRTKFDLGSFIGGMVLASILTLSVYLGYKFACSRNEIRYSTIEEHDAII
ncbi:hypothetical protein AGOR_G00030900 [Albula goreensis]|uniref:Porimin n=1 Tax=Albula goreensis TaxID=1534307 RepID=A0A8T3E6C0_9TELE|nr:hypothetical protein AGOR_G00030900 [Albula goreensis]